MNSKYESGKFYVLYTFDGQRCSTSFCNHTYEDAARHLDTLSWVPGVCAIGIVDSTKKEQEWWKGCDLEKVEML